MDLVRSGFLYFTGLVWDPNFSLFKLQAEAVSFWADAQNDRLQHYLREILFDTGIMETAVHFPCILQRNRRTRPMAPPEIELLVNLGIGVVTFDEEFRLLKVAEGREREVGRSGAIEGKWVCRAFRSSGESPEFLCWYHLGWQFGMGVVNNERFPELKRPRHWIPGKSVWFIRICPVWGESQVSLRKL